MILLCSNAQLKTPRKNLTVRQTLQKKWSTNQHRQSKVIFHRSAKYLTGWNQLGDRQKYKITSVDGFLENKTCLAIYSRCQTKNKIFKTSVLISKRRLPIEDCQYFVLLVSDFCVSFMKLQWLHV